MQTNSKNERITDWNVDLKRRQNWTLQIEHLNILENVLHKANISTNPVRFVCRCPFNALSYQTSHPNPFFGSPSRSPPHSFAQLLINQQAWRSLLAIDFHISKQRTQRAQAHERTYSHTQTHKHTHLRLVRGSWIFRGEWGAGALVFLDNIVAGSTSSKTLRGSTVRSTVQTSVLPHPFCSTVPVRSGSFVRIVGCVTPPPPSFIHRLLAEAISLYLALSLPRWLALLHVASVLIRCKQWECSCRWIVWKVYRPKHWPFSLVLSVKRSFCTRLNWYDKLLNCGGIQNSKTQ